MQKYATHSTTEGPEIVQPVFLPFSNPTEPSRRRILPIQMQSTHHVSNDSMRGWSLVRECRDFGRNLQGSN